MFSPARAAAVIAAASLLCAAFAPVGPAVAAPAAAAKPEKAAAAAKPGKAAKPEKAAAAAKPGKADAVLATYRGGTVTASEFEAFQRMKLGPGEYEQLWADRAAVRGAIMRQALLEVVGVLATESGLRETAAFRDQMRGHENELLAKLWRAKVRGDVRVTEEELERMVPPQPEEVRVAWASFPDEEEASRYAAALRAGGDFAAAARAVGGAEPARGEAVLSAEAETHFSPATKRVILALAVGEVAGPLEEPIGWYVLKAVGRTSVETQRARRRDELRPQVLAAKREDAEAGAIGTLRAKAKISIDEKALTDPAGAGSGRKVAEVNGEPVVFKQEAQHGFPQHGEMEKLLRKQLDRQVDDLLAAQEGRRLGLERADPGWKPAMDAYALDLLTGLYRDQVYKLYQVDEDEVRDYYNRNPEQFKSPAMVRVRQIVLPSGFLARRYREDLVAGRAVFEELARRESIDRESAVIGGDQGWVRENAIRDELRAYVEALKVGEISVPIPIGDNFYILKLDARSERELLPYEQVKEQARPRALLAKRTAHWQEFFERKRKEAQVTLNDAEIDRLLRPAP
ncbi:MAG TPA: peptidyl-prolyl cis-trans isomerase [bacterium]